MNLRRIRYLKISGLMWAVLLASTTLVWGQTQQELKDEKIQHISRYFDRHTYELEKLSEELKHQRQSAQKNHIMSSAVMAAGTLYLFKNALKLKESDPSEALVQLIEAFYPKAGVLKYQGAGHHETVFREGGDYLVRVKPFLMNGEVSHVSVFTQFLFGRQGGLRRLTLQSEYKSVLVDGVQMFKRSGPLSISDGTERGRGVASQMSEPYAKTVERFFTQIDKVNKRSWSFREKLWMLDDFWRNTYLLSSEKLEMKVHFAILDFGLIKTTSSPAVMRSLFLKANIGLLMAGALWFYFTDAPSSNLDQLLIELNYACSGDPKDYQPGCAARLLDKTPLKLIEELSALVDEAEAF